MTAENQAPEQRAALPRRRAGYKPPYRLLPRLFALTLGFALATYGAMEWHYRDLTMHGLWLYDNGWRPHPVHLLVLGLCMVPVSLWQILAIDLEAQAQARQDSEAERGAGDATDASSSEAGTSR